jgi:hypothetical protein
VASPSTPSSRAVSGIRNTDETCWNSVGTGREVCCTHGTRRSSFPYLAMRTLGHLMFPFAHSPSASGGWTVRWCGVLRRGEGVVSCIEDVVVGWLHAPCIERSDTHPPRWHPGSPGERRRSLCCLPTKRHPRVVAKSVSVRASTTRWRSRRTPKSRTCSAMSKQASKQATGRAAHAAGQFSRIRCMRRTPRGDPPCGF